MRVYYMFESAIRWPEFAGKTFIVTGGAKGLGKGVVRAMIASGANVAIAGRSFSAVRAAADEANAYRVGASEAICADVALPDDCERIVAAAYARFGVVDGLVSNAAHFAVVPLAEATPEHAALMMDTNVKGPLFLARAYARELFARNAIGAVVNVSSIAGARPAIGCGLYSASKAALESLTRTMALEWTPSGLRVNAVAPGHIETDGVLADFASGRLSRERMLASIPARRIAAPGDVADAVMFLLSERARHITGVTLTVDGGEGM